MAEDLRTAATALLETVDTADAVPLDRLLPLVYSELREMAHRRLAEEGGQVTLHTTDLVHEAYLRLVDDARVTSRGRAYFFAAAAQAMRRVLIDAARRRSAGKRGGGAQPVTLEEGHSTVDEYALELLDLDRALTSLQAESPRQVQVVECRFFGGLSVEETAAALDISARTVKSDWAMARAWLHMAVQGTEPSGLA